MAPKFWTATKLIGAMLPLVVAIYSGVSYAEQSRNIEDRVMALEIQDGRMDERYRAIIARLDAQEKTLWWLIAATFGSATVSGGVAVDRIRHSSRNEE